MRLAYFTNQYPAVSHTFIRREVQAIEALGMTVRRYAVRPGESLIDPEDKMERGRTRYILDVGLLEIVRCCVRALLNRPITTMQVFGLSIRMGWRSDRGILRHLVYVAEATVLADWCRKDCVQHIHAHFGTNPAAIAMFAHRFCDVSYSFTAHGSEEFEKAALLSLEEKLERASFAVCVSSFGRGQLMRWVRPALWRKISVVRCGISESYRNAPIPAIDFAPRLVCVGRLDEHKAQILLVDAVKRLRDAGLQCELVLVGDGDWRPLVEQAIHRAGLGGCITITGWVSGDVVRAQITASRALVLPSFSENLPVVIMEAMALGRPVISTYVAGIPELVQPGETGWLVPTGDEEALAEAMREALNASVEQLAAMGAAGRRIVGERHDTLKEAIKLKALFERPSKNLLNASRISCHS